MRFLRSKRGIAALAALLLILFLYRPGAYRLRTRIAGAIGAAIGRTVTIDNVRVRLLPRPGFDLEGLVIADDPEFSTEPMVRAQDVSAAIRLRSLLRGRLEIANLSATEPSINLVRNDQGRWNLANLLERSTHIGTAPTGKNVSSSRPAFPYLEASHARINFKLGQEKKAWALTDADVALWQESEDSWGARMAAQPTRTDVNLTDMGLIRINATWQRGQAASGLPLQMTVGWSKGQLGQITKLFSGRDRGWRGDVSFTANLAGPPNALQIQSQGEIDNFRRFDIMNGASVRLSTACSGTYDAVEHTLDKMSCESPVAGGSIRLSGQLGPIQAGARYDMKLVVDKVPLASVVPLVRQAKRGLPEDLVATGHLAAEFHAARSSAGARWDGKGTISGARLSANAGRDQISLGDIPIALSDGAARGRGSRRDARPKPGEPSGPHLVIGSFPLVLAAGTPAAAGGWFTPADYRLFLRGETEIKNLYRLANIVGVPGFRPLADGSAKVDVSLSGSWQGFEAPAITGTAQLHNVRTGMRGLNPAIEIATATVTLDSETVALDRLSAQMGESHWTGSIRLPRHCAPGSCVWLADLAADRMSTAGLAEWFTPHPVKRPWYRILSSNESQGKSPLASIRAVGKLHVNRFSIKKVDATQIVAHVELDRGKVTLRDLHADLLQGTHQGLWVIDATTQPLRYQVTGILQNISLAQVGAVMNDSWITGTVDSRIDLTAAGSTFPELLAHADGQLKFAMQNGAFNHMGLPDAAKPFPVHLFAGRVQIKDGTWNLNAGRIESHDGIYQISGTASPASGLSLVLTRGDEQSWNVTGTLLKPRLTRAARTEARTVIKP